MCMPNPLAYLTDQLDELKRAGGHFRLRELESACDPISRVDGQEVINLASNNYLGLANHPKLREAAIAAVRQFGAGTGAVRTITGTMAIHMELERRIAAFKHSEACVVFQSGFTANAGAVDSILTPEDHIVSDELNHASIIDGCRLSRAKIHVFRHRDVAHAEELLEGLKETPGHKLLITDGVFSMDGDIGPLDKLTALAERYGAIMMVNDAHASGVLGSHGRGTVDHFGLHGRVQVQVGTLSKAVGVLGGYVCGSRDLIDYLYHRARPFLFSTSHPPAVTAACIAAFEIMENEPERDPVAVGQHALLPGRAQGRGLRHRRHGNAYHADHRRRGSHRARVLRRVVPRRPVGHRHRLSDGAARQSPHPHHRHRRAYARTPRPRRGDAHARRPAYAHPAGVNGI